MTNEARGRAANEGTGWELEPELDDHTVVVSHAEDREADDHTIVSVQPSVEGVLDHTVVSAQRPVEGVLDHTVVVNQPHVDQVIADVADIANVDQTVVVNQSRTEGSEVLEIDDHTLASVQHPADEVSDHTVVVSQARAENIGESGEHLDHTVALNQVQGVGLEVEGESSDYTVVANHPQKSGGQEDEACDPLPVSEGTMVVPQRRRGRRGDARGAAVAGVQGKDPAPPVADPKPRRSLRRIVGGGLDPNRPIAEAPGSMPWEVQPAGVRGVAQGLPVSYGTRVATDMPVERGIDMVQRVIGPAPAARPVLRISGREQLPSLTRRDRRRRMVTLAIYAGVTVLCVLGLWGVAAIAFGW